MFITPTIPRHSILNCRKQNIPTINPEQFYCNHVYLAFLDELVNNIKSRLTNLKSERIILLSKLRPEVIVHENLFELSKHLSRQNADRLPSPLELHSELERWQKKCNDLIKINNDWKKKWIKDLIQETD